MLQECDHIIKLAEPTLNRSTVVTQNGGSGCDVAC